jgi:hypothetical protein
MRDEVNRPKAENMEHLDITEFTLTAKPALDTVVDECGYAVSQGFFQHRMSAGPAAAQRGVARAEGMLLDGGEVGRGGRQAAPLAPPLGN